MRTALLLPIALAALLRSPAAHATPPTVPECLAATEAALQARNAHKLRDARAQLLVCAAASCPADVRTDCSRGVEELNAALPTVVFTAKASTGDELTAVTVSMDGRRLTDHLDGSALTLDPGSHDFTFEVAGKPTVTRTLVLHEGEKDRRESVVLSPTVVADATPRGSSFGTLRIVGVTAGGVGVVGLVLGGVFGAVASSDWSSVKSACPSFTHCSEKVVDEASSAKSFATLSTVSFIAGGVLAAGGVTLFFVAPSGSSPGVGLDVGPRGLSLKGAF